MLTTRTLYDHKISEVGIWCDLLVRNIDLRSECLSLDNMATCASVFPDSSILMNVALEGGQGNNAVADDSGHCAIAVRRRGGGKG